MGLIVRLYNDSTFFWGLSNFLPHCWCQCHDILQWIQCLIMKITCFLFFYRPQKWHYMDFHIWFLKLLLLQCNSNKVVKKVSLKDWKAFLSFPQIYIEQSLQACISGKNIWHRQWRKEIKMQFFFGKAGIKKVTRGNIEIWSILNHPLKQVLIVLHDHVTQAFRSLRVPEVPAGVLHHPTSQ